MPAMSMAIGQAGSGKPRPAEARLDTYPMPGRVSFRR
jgi:hypothetical protein